MKKILLACGVVAAMLPMVSCNKGSNAGSADNFADSLALYMGRTSGAMCSERISSLPETEREKFQKEAFLRGLKQVLMADTSDVAYFYGVSIGMNIAQQIMSFGHEGVGIDPEVVYNNFATTFKADSLDIEQMNIEQGVMQQLMMQAQNLVQANRMKAQEAAQAARAGEAAENEAKGAAFVADAKKADPEIKTTESGLSYKVVAPGTGANVTDTDVVKVHYTGKLINGEVFDSSVDRGEPADFSVGQVVPGFGEGLKLMKKGAKYTLYIPAALAYGNNSVGTIPAGSTLIFDVEVLDVTPGN